MKKKPRIDHNRENEEVHKVADSYGVTESKERISQIDAEARELQAEAEAAYQEIRASLQEVLKTAETAREKCSRLADLKAEAFYLSLRHDLTIEEVPSPKSCGSAVNAIWRDLQGTLQAPRASRHWLDKIRELEERKAAEPTLTEEERAELESRLKDNVCPICVSFALDGNCTLQAFETCPITRYLDQLVEIVGELGHRPWMEDYFERMYREICPGCEGRAEIDHCPPRDEGDCSLFTYLPSVVRTIENFFAEREKRQEATG